MGKYIPREITNQVAEEGIFIDDEASTVGDV